MNVWFVLPALLFVFVVASTILYVYGVWKIYGEAASKTGKEHLSANQYFLIAVLLLQVLSGVMAGTVMVLFKKK